MGQIKKQKELEAINRACAITAATFRFIKKQIKVGMSERQIADTIEKILHAQGGEDLAFPTIVAIGSHAATPHHVPTNRKLTQAGFVLLDFGCTIRGYHADMTRMVFLAPPKGVMKKIYLLVRLAQQKALAAVRPGVCARKVDRVARDIITRAGYGKNFTHSTGHGVGRKIHEPPWINQKNTERLLSGMVITVEPGIYLSGIGGVRIEDTLVVTKTGYQILT